MKLHLIKDYDLGEIFRYINPVMLYTRHLGFKNFENALAAGDPKATELRKIVARVEDEMLANPESLRERLTGSSRLIATAIGP